MKYFSILGLFISLAAQAVAQPPGTVQVISINGITAQATVIDNRSTQRQSYYHGYCATGTGTWSVTVQYASATGGPWTSFPDGDATVTNTSASCVGAGSGYHPYVRFSITGSVLINYTGTKWIYIPTTGGTGGGGSTGFNSITTGANTTAAMTVASGASLTFAGSGVINANNILGVDLSTLTGVIKMSSGVPSVAASANIIAMWTGTCNSTTYLRADGTCQPASGGAAGTVTSITIAGTANQITATGTCTVTTSGTCTLSIPTSPTLPGTTTGTFSGNLTGNVTGTASTITGLIVKSNTPFTTKGDLWVTDGTNMNRLGVGADGQILTADAASTNGVKWTAVGGVGTVTSVGQSFTGGLISVSGSPVTTAGTLALTVAGTSGGIPYFSSASTWASSALLTNHGVLIGGGAGASPKSTAAGTAGQVLTSNGAAADPTFQTVTGTGSVTSVQAAGTGIFAFTGGPITSSGTLTMTQTGNSGGIPYFSDANTLATSATFTASRILLGGGAGSAPTFMASLGTTTTVLHGNAAGVPSFGSIVNGDITNATIDVTAKITGVVPAANGGTGSAFTAFSGPGASVKTFILPNVNSTILTSNAAVTVPQGGTGLTTITAHSILIGNGTGSPTLLAAGAVGTCLSGTGTSSDPGFLTCSSIAQYTTVSFSATPTFNATSATTDSFKITLTNNVTSSTLSGASTGEVVTFKICQDGGGGHTFAWPANVSNPGTIDSTGSGCSNQSFVFDGTNAQPLFPLYVTGVPGSALTFVGATSGSTILQPQAIAAGTVGLPKQTGSLPTAYFCGATTGNQACANTDTGGTARVISGLATLASNSAVISSITPAFTSTTTFACTSNDQTTIANPTKIVNTSSSSITITNTGGATDVIAYSCVGY